MHIDSPSSALLIVGHGSTVNPDSSGPTWQQAAALRKRGLFREVACCFWKEEPSLRDALLFFDDPEIAEVYVVPNFISEGYFTETVIPRELELNGRLTTRPGGQVWKYCAPVGSHPGVTELLLQRAREVAPGVAEAETSLLIVGHGTATEREQRGRGQAGGGKNRRPRPLRLGPEHLHGRSAADFGLGQPNDHAKRGGGAVFYLRRPAQLPGHPGVCSGSSRNRPRPRASAKSFSAIPASCTGAIFTTPARSGPSRDLPKSSSSRRQLSTPQPLISARLHKLLFLPAL